ncbi:PRAME family member 8-like [Erethizon dorsatum]
MEICEMPFDTFMDVLKMLELNCVQEVEVCHLLGVKNLASFAPYLVQMRNLQTLAFFSFSNGYYSTSRSTAEYVDELILHLRELSCLQELYVDCAHFLKGHLHRVLRFTRMSTQSPPTLLQLTVQNLLRDKSLAMEAVEDLPGELFPPVFMEAFTRGHTEILKVMLQCLQEVYADSVSFLEGHLDQVLRFLRMSMQSPPPLYELIKQSLLKSETTVSTALHDLPAPIFHDIFMDAFMGEHDEVLKFGEITPQQRNLQTLEALLEGLDIQLSRKVHHRWKLQVLDWRDVYQDFWTLLRAVQLESIHELDVFSDWGRKSMEAFVPQLKKMKNLHTFHFSSLSAEVFTSPSKNRWYSRIYAFHLGQLQSLRELHIDDVFFLRGTLHKVLRSQTPLEALSLSSSPLKESDLKHLSQCASTSQLKSLTLRRLSMKSFNPETLQVLLDKLASTLETLALEHCDITDSQLLAILPALSRCSQLKTFSCYGNHLSLGILQVLLRLTAGLSQLTQGLYPAPLESYESNIPGRIVHPELFAQALTQVPGHDPREHASPGPA